VDVRTFMIRSQLAQAESSIIVIGDSITEAALFPSSLCGHTIINAGVGGVSVPSYFAIAKQLLPDEPAALIVIALGTNDSAKDYIQAPTVEAGYTQLLDLIRQHSAKARLVAKCHSKGPAQFIKAVRPSIGIQLRRVVVKYVCAPRIGTYRVHGVQFFDDRQLLCPIHAKVVQSPSSVAPMPESSWARTKRPLITSGGKSAARRRPPTFQAS
jgi:GDSL-like Lipase/Acylhydrolase family